MHKHIRGYFGMRKALSGPATRLAKVFVLAAMLLGLIACSQPDIPPWTEGEMEELLEYFGEVGEAYALVDMCIPMIEADPEAKYQLVTAIEADRYARIRQMDTDQELKKLFAYFRQRGGTSQQNIDLRLRYEEARRLAEDQISSVQVCVDTITDYANTIINMRVH